MNVKGFVTIGLTVLRWSASAWDFEYGYQSVFSANADAYVLSQVNVEKVVDGPFSYYTTANWSPARVTYRFDFANPVSSAFLYANVAGEYFPETLTEASIWASRDGNNWIQLVSDFSADENFEPSYYNQNLPESVVGGNQVWIEARLHNAPDIDFARFSIADSRTPGEVFQFKATLVPEPSVMSFALIAVGLCVGGHLWKRRQNSTRGHGCPRSNS